MARRPHPPGPGRPGRRRLARLACSQRSRARHRAAEQPPPPAGPRAARPASAPPPAPRARRARYWTVSGAGVPAAFRLVCVQTAAPRQPPALSLKHGRTLRHRRRAGPELRGLRRLIRRVGSPAGQHFILSTPPLPLSLSPTSPRPLFRLSHSPTLPLFLLSSEPSSFPSPSEDPLPLPPRASAGTGSVRRLFIRVKSNGHTGS